MNEQTLKRRSRLMVGLIVIVALYLGFIAIAPFAIIGDRVTDGVIGLLLGLYLCSHPAANMVDLIYFRQEIFDHLAAANANARWLTLNAIAMIMGWVVITLSVTWLIH